MKPKPDGETITLSENNCARIVGDLAELFDAKVVKMSKSMEDRITANLPRTGIYTALTAIMKEVPYIAKDQRNTFQKYNYRSIDQIYNALQRLFAKHGVITTSRVEGYERAQNGKATHVSMIVHYTFHAADGSTITTSAPGESIDHADKATTQALVMAHKYALVQSFMIPTEEPDPDSKPVPSTPKKSPAPAKTAGKEPFNAENEKHKAALDKMLAGTDVAETFWPQIYALMQGQFAGELPRVIEAFRKG